MPWKTELHTDTRLILIPTGWETEWANVTTPIQRWRNILVNLLVVSVSNQTKIINF